jgi:hypothetical protein
MISLSSSSKVLMTTSSAVISKKMSSLLQLPEVNHQLEGPQVVCLQVAWPDMECLSLVRSLCKDTDSHSKCKDTDSHSRCKVTDSHSKCKDTDSHSKCKDNNLCMDTVPHKACHKLWPLANLVNNLSMDTELQDRYLLRTHTVSLHNEIAEAERKKKRKKQGFKKSESSSFYLDL